MTTEVVTKQALTTDRLPGSPLRAVEETADLVIRRMRHMRAAPGRLIGVILNPLVLLLAVGYLFKDAIRLPVGTTDYVDYLMPGVALQVGLASVGPTAISVSGDVQRGLMERFRSMPISRRSVLIAHSLADLVLAAVALLVLGGIGLALGWRPSGGAAGVLSGVGLALVFAYAMIWVGIALGMAVKHAESIDSIGALLLVVLTFLSTAVLPPTAMPGWVRAVAEWNPVSTGSRLIRDAWGTDAPTGGSYPAAHPGVVAAVVLGAVLLGSAAYALRTFTNRA
ncbi:ABC transporter permease [Luteipulveratus sp. YIM 133132]|uniref:ABC transporter permease n=1 Tax=Luteipulveratus flavus TaxID=3031728 RepID=UPI0023B087E0|nr:ABC transporter permease [Luteipulveratus sp. YIM 133132]MDE9365085.1 ABC transporter permease [Luteipulveratus sp. YIM 133132]